MSNNFNYIDYEFTEKKGKEDHIKDKNGKRRINRRGLLDCKLKFPFLIIFRHSEHREIGP
jgi:hypothetical protein